MCSTPHLVSTHCILWWSQASLHFDPQVSTSNFEVEMLESNFDVEMRGSKRWKSYQSLCKSIRISTVCGCLCAKCRIHVNAYKTYRFFTFWVPQPKTYRKTTCSASFWVRFLVAKPSKSLSFPWCFWGAPAGPSRECIVNSKDFNGLARLWRESCKRQQNHTKNTFFDSRHKHRPCTRNSLETLKRMRGIAFHAFFHFGTRHPGTYENY